MPRLRNVLDLLAKPENTHLWLLLDIKTTNDADTVMRLIAQDIAETPAPEDHPWETRVVMGIWAVCQAKYRVPCIKSIES